MAFTERYVTVAGAGAHDGTSEANAWTFAEMIAATPAAETRVNIKAGSYSEGVTTLPALGTAVQPIILRGYNSTIGDLDGQGRATTDQTLTTTNMPDITITGIWTPSAFCFLQNLDITGALSSALIGSNAADSWGMTNCRVTNTQNNASARCLQIDNNGQLVNCDFVCTGAAHAALVDADVGLVIIGCRFTPTAGNECVSMDNGVVCKSVFSGGSIHLRILTPSVGTTNIISDCTFYAATTAAIQLPNSAPAATPPLIVNNHVTDCAKYLDGLYTATDDTPVIELWNRTRDNTTPRTGILSAVLGGEVTTDTGAAATDYTDAASGDFELIDTAAGYATGMIPFQDIGAIQHQDPAGGSGGGPLIGGRLVG